MQEIKIQGTFSGNSNTTYTCPKSCNAFSIKNDGSSNLSFTINGITITVKPNEEFSDSFEWFSEVTVTTTVAFRALVKSF